MENAINAFVKLMETATNEHITGGFGYAFSVKPGRKYAKIIRSDVWEGEQRVNGQRSAAGFIDMQTGDIYKAATWSAPAKGVRGNVLVNGGKDALDSHGYIRYAR